MLDRLHLRAVEAYHAPFPRVVYDSMRECVAWRRVAPARQALGGGLDDAKQGHLQNNKLSRPQCGHRNREDGKADHEADQGCQIAPSKDE